MAKKKTFDNVVDESFREGYTSEPETPAVTQEESRVPESTPEKNEPNKPEVLSESEKTLRAILAGDKDALQALWGREDRSTYYLTDYLRACIDVLSHEEGIKKNDVVTSALERYFSDAVKETARELVVSRAIKKLEKKIQEEKENM